MSNEALPVKITVGGVTLDAELKPTRTAKAVYELLPIETDLHSWGEEFYFKIPFIKDHRDLEIELLAPAMQVRFDGQQFVDGFGRAGRLELRIERHPSHRDLDRQRFVAHPSPSQHLVNLFSRQKQG